MYALCSIIMYYVLKCSRKIIVTYLFFLSLSNNCTIGRVMPFLSLEMLYDFQNKSSLCI